jgi:hypothetical protein
MKSITILGSITQKIKYEVMYDLGMDPASRKVNTVSDASSCVRPIFSELPTVTTPLANTVLHIKTTNKMVTVPEWVLLIHK